MTNNDNIHLVRMRAEQLWSELRIAPMAKARLDFAYAGDAEKSLAAAQALGRLVEIVIDHRGRK